MATLDSLPPDQRAVLQLVLQRERSYDQIASLLSIDPAAVRQRAVDALAALTPPDAPPPPAELPLVTDYLLGQLPRRVAGQVHGLLATAGPDRDWALAIAAALQPLAPDLGERIPAPATDRAPYLQQADSERTATEAQAATEAEAEAEAFAPLPRRGRERRVRERPAGSREGGRMLLAGLAAVVVIVVVIIVVASGGGSAQRLHPRTRASVPGRTTSTAATTPVTGSGTTVLAQLNLTAPTTANDAKGVVFVVRELVDEREVTGIIVEAQDVPANTKENAYALWLSNSEDDSKFLGYVPHLVTKSGVLDTSGALPADATSYSHLLITVEPYSAKPPKLPGTVVLSGPFSESKSS